MIHITDNHIEFLDPGCRYNSFFGISKDDRTPWRKYYKHVITLLGGSYALYLPDQGEVAYKYTENIIGYNPPLETIIEGLKNDYGIIDSGIDEYELLNDEHFESPPYYIDYFEDLKYGN